MEWMKVIDGEFSLLIWTYLMISEFLLKGKTIELFEKYQ